MCVFYSQNLLLLKLTTRFIAEYPNWLEKLVPMHNLMLYIGIQFSKNKILIEGYLWVAVGGRIWREINILTSNLTWLDCRIWTETLCCPKILVHGKNISNICWNDYIVLEYGSKDFWWMADQSSLTILLWTINFLFWQNVPTFT